MRPPGYGVVVVNTPDSNSISACEQTIALMLAAARNLPQANATLKQGGWGRNRFMGNELFGKTVGIVGLGRIGALVATRLKAFGMRVIAYDPYIAPERFKRFGAERMETLDDLVRQADFITVHTPKTEETIGMIGEEQFRIRSISDRQERCAGGQLRPGRHHRRAGPGRGPAPGDCGQRLPGRVRQGALRRQPAAGVRQRGGHAPYRGDHS